MYTFVFNMIALEKPSQLTGFPKKLVDCVDYVKAKLPQLPPLGVGTGVGFGCGIGLGCGVGIGIVGVGYGQGWGWYLFKDKRRQRSQGTLGDVETKLKLQLFQFVNALSLLFSKWNKKFNKQSYLESK
ncbi:hypothetical protein Gasu2_29110 [Galdieria sulphuraria]|nr:hypothetical protein Gasu2_29110 [Galdieria sulphuraria]